MARDQVTGVLDVDVYVVTKNSGPGWLGPDPLTLLYMGCFIEEALQAIPENFRKYNADPERCKEFPDIWSVLPKDMKREYVAFYMADGWWYSVARTIIQTY